MANFDRWTAQKDALPHTELAEIILDESGYTDMWQKDRSADAAGRLENLKELVRSMEEFENLQGFLEHISLVMDADRGEQVDSVSIMTLHSAKGLEFETVFLPGWEEGLFPSQRSLDEQGRAGLEEERRLAHVGLTRARRRAKIYFATNRRIHGMWNDQHSVALSRRIAGGRRRGDASRRAASRSRATAPRASTRQESFGSSYSTPGWQRAQARGGFPDRGARDARRSGGRWQKTEMPDLAAAPRAQAADDRGRTGREIDRRRRRPTRSATACSTSNSATATLLRRRQQADHPVRQGGREEGGR